MGKYQKKSVGLADIIIAKDRRVAQIERWARGWKGGYLPEPIHLIIERLLRIIRDQRAELTQAHQAITNMRNYIDGK